MRKALALGIVTILFATSSFATYVVILKDGTRYRAKQRWNIVAGKAMIHLENGTTLQMDPGLIDVAKSDEQNRAGLGDVKILATEPASQQETRPQESLGSITKLRRPKANSSAPAESPAAATTPVPPPAGGNLGSDVLSRYGQAYENVGIFDAKIVPSGTNRLRIELTADTEDQVFKAISATSYVTVKMPEATGSVVDQVELFMKTVSGGSAGKFQMTKEDAQAIVDKKITWQDYYISKVIF